MLNEQSTVHFQDLPDDDERDPIYLLLQFHGRLRSALAELHALSETKDPVVKQERAVALFGFFSNEIAYHDLDEEASLLPRIREIKHPERLNRVLKACQNAHERIEDEIDSFIPQLNAMAQGMTSITKENVLDLHKRISNLLLPHMRLEEEEIFPLARLLLPPGILRDIGEEMNRRRADRQKGRRRAVEIASAL